MEKEKEMLITNPGTQVVPDNRKESDHLSDSFLFSFPKSALTTQMTAGYLPVPFLIGSPLLFTLLCAPGADHELHQ